MTLKLKLLQLKILYMKQRRINKFEPGLKRLFIFIGLLLTGLLPCRTFAQTDSTAKTAEGPALLSPSLEFVSVQKADSSIDLRVTMKTKFKGSTIKLALLKVKFAEVSDTLEKELGFVITDLGGKGSFNVKPGQFTPDKDGKLHFKAMFAGNKSMDPVDGEVTVKRARLEIVPVKEDSLLTVKVKLIDLSSGKEMPVDKATIGVFVKRQFLPLKLAEGTTDATGEASVEIPNNLPGDAKGNITLVARLDENEDFGNLEASVVQNWGTPVSDLRQELPRALWSAHPPIWMLITFVILVGTVWGHYIVIIYELFRLRKEEPHAPLPVTNP